MPHLMPRLLFCVRDHELGNLEDKHGNVQTENEFLEFTLSQMVKNSKRKVINTRDKIVQLFPDRELVLINCPLEEDRRDELGDLHRMEFQYLNE